MPPSSASNGADPNDLIARLTALGDAARLRMLRLLAREELSVGELARALQLPQSTVSRHLKTLHEGEWLTKRSEGTASLYRLTAEALEPGQRGLWALAEEHLAGGASPTFDEDDARLQAVLKERQATNSSAFFGRLGGEWDQVRRHLFGRGFTARALLGLIPPEWVVADLGCGTGDAARWLAPLVRKVVAVDREPAMLEAARRRLAEFDNVEFVQGELDALPLDDASLDAAVISLVLHHVPEPGVVVKDVARALKPGGRMLIVDIVRHDREEYRHTMGHVHLGFAEEAVRGWAEGAGLEVLRWRRLVPEGEAKGPGVFVGDLGRG